MRKCVERKHRPALGLYGSAVGVAGIVAMIPVAHGMRDSISIYFEKTGASLVVMSRGVADIAFSRVSPEEVAIIEAIDGPMDASLPTSVRWPRQSESKLREALSDVAAHARSDLAAIKLSHLIPVAGD